MKIHCSQWQPDIWNLSASPNLRLLPSDVFEAFTAAAFRCCLFASPSAFSFIFNNWKACLAGLSSGGWLGFEEYSIFLPWETLELLWVIICCTVKCCLVSFATFCWIWVESIAVYPAVYGCLVPLAAIHGWLHAHTIILPPWQMKWYALDNKLFLLFSNLFSSHHSFVCPKNCFVLFTYLQVYLGILRRVCSGHSPLSLCSPVASLLWYFNPLFSKLLMLASHSW